MHAVQPEPTVVVRLGALGDVVLAGAITGALAPVQFVTSEPWAEVAGRLPGVVSVIRRGVDALPKHPARVVDLQGDLRTRRVVAAMAPQRVQRVARYDLVRRGRVWWKGPPAPRVVDRYAAAAEVTVAAKPWIAGWRGGAALVLVPGAQWATKRWPTQSWFALGRRYPGPVVVVGGLDDSARVDSIVAALGPKATALVERGFSRTFAALSDAAAVVAGDTGLLHLAGAMGVPLVGLFGPTCSDDGFWCHDGVVVEQSMRCRPCSRYGSDACPLGHHRCLAGLSVDAVWAALAQVLP